MATSIKPCNCVSKFQDKTYGTGNRVFNYRAKKGSKGWRCTVCGRKIDAKKEEVLYVDE